MSMLPVCNWLFFGSSASLFTRLCCVPIEGIDMESGRDQICNLNSANPFAHALSLVWVSKLEAVICWRQAKCCGIGLIDVAVRSPSDTWISRVVSSAETPLPPGRCLIILAVVLLGSHWLQTSWQQPSGLVHKAFPSRPRPLLYRNSAQGTER